jgi:hypothetical protein
MRHPVSTRCRGQELCGGGMEFGLVSRHEPSARHSHRVEATERNSTHHQHGLPTGRCAAVDNAPHGLLRGGCVVHSQAQWTTRHRSASTTLNKQGVAQ